MGQEIWLAHAYRVLNNTDSYAGDVMCFKVPGNYIIVLSSQGAASDLLDKRGAIYSGRPNFVLYKMYELIQESSSRG